MTTSPCRTSTLRTPPRIVLPRFVIDDALVTALLVFMAWAQGGDVEASHGGCPELAYIGPGAGLALAGSFLAILAAMLSAMLALLFWPFRWAWRAIRGRRARRRALVRRVVVLGLDGLEPSLVDQFLAEGLMPNLDRLRQSGSYARLGTTWPPLSPVAWSSFSTGTNPGKHNVFDFIARNTADYRPMISSVRIRPGKRQLRIGRYRIPLSGSEIRGLRKSRPFWCALGDAGIFSAVLRVPITFPPDHFHGVQLSAMCVPDLRGSQGMFCHFVENGHAGATSEGDVGGERIVVQRNGKGVRARLPGPPNPLRSDHQMADVPLKVVAGKNGAAVLHVDGQRVDLRPGEYTDWVGLTFPLAPMVKVRGICRFYLKRFEPPFEMYCTPVNIDPEKPVMPISHPAVFSTYLARQHGPFATLGLAEDTWSLSESVLDEDAFLQQAYDIDEERQRMFFDMLGRVPRGFVSCVFDAPDRIQHMFWRFHDKEHPARPADEALQAAHQHRLRDLYERMDALVGRTIDALDEDTTLFVMSDHGFKSFRRCVDLNAWLLEQGYLALKDDRSTSRHEYLADVDWSRTRAYAIGLAGIYVNQQGREAEGIVSPREAEALAKDIADRLTGLRDPQHDQVAIHQAVARAAVYKGPYTEQAPDVIVGYREGYRVSWDTAIGKCGAGVFSDNTKAWSGDHCIHPELVPGVLFCNRKLDAATANIIDIAPTALELLGVTKPAYMDGKSLLCAGETSSN